MHVGGTPEAAGLTDRDLEIVAEIGPTLRDMGIVFAGIDIIGRHLTEINVTSPTCIREIKDFGGPDIAVMIWDAIEALRRLELLFEIIFLTRQRVLKWCG